MKPENFCYWLKGALELFENSSEHGLSGDQVKCILEHLNLVFVPVTKTAIKDFSLFKENHGVDLGLLDYGDMPQVSC